MTIDHVSQVTNGSSSARRPITKVKKDDEMKENKHTQVLCLGSKEGNEIGLG